MQNPKREQYFISCFFYLFFFFFSFPFSVCFFFHHEVAASISIGVIPGVDRPRGRFIPKFSSFIARSLLFSRCRGVGWNRDVQWSGMRNKTLHTRGWRMPLLAFHDPAHSARSYTLERCGVAWVLDEIYGIDSSCLQSSR